MNYKQNGFIAFTSVLVIAAIALAIVMSISLLGINEAQASLSLKKSQETLQIAQSCVEEALLQLRNDNTFSGLTLSVGDGSCSISITETGANKTIDVTADLIGPPDYTRRLRVTARTVHDDVNLLTWEEIP